MKLVIPTVPPFSFDQTLAFSCRFAPLETAAIVEPDRLVAAFAHRGVAWACELRAPNNQLTLTVADGAPEHVIGRATDLVGARDDLRPFYALAAADPVMAPVVGELHGLHQVRFLGLEEIAVYCVMMQRTPIKVAAAYKQRFLARFGFEVAVGPDRTLRAMPELADLVHLGAAEIADALRGPADQSGKMITHRGKAERIATVVREVHRIGEDFLVGAPYAAARDALLAIPGIGPFSAAAILLRGLGRVDEVPSLEMFEEPGRARYGRAWDPAWITRHYGRSIGTWAFYLKTAAGRRVSVAA
jgi:DNA-3-methyladenine glycosylase II